MIKNDKELIDYINQLIHELIEQLPSEVLNEYRVKLHLARTYIDLYKLRNEQNKFKPSEPSEARSAKDFKWTDEEKQYLIDNYSKIKIAQMAANLRRTPGAIKTYATKLGLKRPRRGNG